MLSLEDYNKVARIVRQEYLKDPKHTEVWGLDGNHQFWNTLGNFLPYTHFHTQTTTDFKLNLLCTNNRLLRPRVKQLQTCSLEQFSTTIRGIIKIIVKADKS